MTPNASLARCPTCGVAGPHAEGSTCSALSSCLDRAKAFIVDTAGGPWVDGHEVLIATLLAEVRRETIEECAKVCDERAAKYRLGPAGAGAEWCAKLIRDLPKGSKAP